jgi:hypothetical protein
MASRTPPVQIEKVDARPGYVSQIGWVTYQFVHPGSSSMVTCPMQTFHRSYLSPNSDCVVGRYRSERSWVVKIYRRDRISIRAPQFRVEITITPKPE